MTLNPAPAFNVTVIYAITVSGNYGVSAAAGRSITVTGSRTLDLATTDDGVIEANGSITVTITGVNFGTLPALPAAPRSRCRTPG